MTILVTSGCSFSECKSPWINTWPKQLEQLLNEAYEKARQHMASGGTASSRADGIAQRGKTRGTIVMCGGGMYK